MKSKDLHHLTAEELEARLVDVRRAQREAQDSVAAGKEKNVRVIRGHRRDVARVATILAVKRSVSSAEGQVA